MINSLNIFLKQMLDSGLKIDTVYDIGANNGQWSMNMKYGALRDSHFYLFEANPDHKEELDKTKLPYFIGVLSSPEKDSVEFYKADTTGDSYYKENTPHYDNVKSVTYPCYTLDDIFQIAKLPVPNFIKIDTQGSELDILKGAKCVLDQVDLIYMECPIIQYNVGAPNIQNYLDFMHDNGFMPMELLETHVNESTLVQIDIMFINRHTKDRMFGKNKYIRPF